MPAFKSIVLCGLFFLVLGWGTTPIFAACPDNFSASLNPLDFGEFIPNSGGVLRLFPNGDIRPTSGSVVHVGGGSAGSVSVAGAVHTQVLIEGFQPTTITSDSASMQVVFFETSPSFVVIDSSCTGEFKIGATLIINENQPQGLYEGYIDITIRHQ